MEEVSRLQVLWYPCAQIFRRIPACVLEKFQVSSGSLP